MSTANSPYYAAGVSDAERDAAEVKAGREPLGMDGARSWSVMYRTGYRDGLAGDNDSTGPDGAITVAPIDVDVSAFTA